MKRKVILFGGTGYIGGKTAYVLKSRGYHPILVGRKVNLLLSEFETHTWDMKGTSGWYKLLENAHAIVNLAGKSVDCIKTPKNCDEILRSRVDSTKLIAKALGLVKYPPKVWVQMSTAHIYGDSEQVYCDETATLGYGLAPFVGKKWEKTFEEVCPKYMRGVVLRTSFVLGKHQGAFPKLRTLAKLGLGGQIASGKQGISWIHETDMANMICEAIEKDDYKGVFNVSAPEPVSQKQFMQQLRQQLRMPLGLPAPAFLIRWGAKYVLKTDAELILYGRYIVPGRLQKMGFSFRYPNLESALKELV